MYVAVENFTRMVAQILVGVVPYIIMDRAGYVANGGCDCGCGVSCAAIGVPYARWICGTDYAYTCDGSLTSPILFGDADRVAPCTVQNSSVTLIIKACMTIVPAICALLAIFPTLLMQFTGPIHEAVLQEVAKRDADPSYVPKDPTTGLDVILPSRAPVDVFMEHFTQHEQMEAGKDEKVIGKLFYLVRNKFAFSVILTGALVGAMIVWSNENVLAVGFIVLSMLLVLLAIHYRRFQLVL